VNFPESWWNHLPHWLVLPLLALACIFWVLSKVAGAHEGFAKLIPVFGKIWHARAQRRDPAWVDAELRDLRRTVEFQGKQLEELRQRDEMYWAWILSDQEWHRAVEFAAVTNDWKLPPHISFMQFRDGWLASHSKKEELPF
jgi:hypothetical protein